MIVKQGDVYPVPFQVNADITGCTAKVIVRARDAGGAVTEYDNQSVTDPANGIVSWAYDGTLDVGSYNMEIELARAGDNTKETAPTEGYFPLTVQCDLDGE